MNTKKTIKKTALALALAMTTLVMAGCGSKKPAPPVPVVSMVVGNHANRRPVDFTLAQEMVMEAAMGYGGASVVNADGSSQYMGYQSLDIEDRYKGAAPERLKMDAMGRTQMLLSYAAGLRADDPEVDYLEALRLAAVDLQGRQGDKKTILFLGTGLNTVGLMDFNRNLLSAEPELVVDALEGKDAVPDLHGIEVCFVGLGQVAGDQPALTPHQQKCLEELWRTLVTRGGGTPQIISSLSAIPAGEEALPPVSVVDFPEETPIEFTPEQLSETGLEAPLQLSETQLCFAPDSAAYIDGAQAAEVLRPVAEYMDRHEEMRLLVAGTTAGDENGPAALELSGQRAGTVKSTLAEAGVDPDRISAVGLGCENPWHIPGLGYGPGAGANRKVVLMDADSALAQELLA